MIAIDPSNKQRLLVLAEKLKGAFDYTQVLIYLNTDEGYRLIFKYSDLYTAKELIKEHSKFFVFWGDFAYFDNEEEFKRITGITQSCIAIYKLEGLGFLIASRDEKRFSSQEMVNAKSIVDEIKAELEHNILKESVQKLEEDYANLVSLVPTGIAVFKKSDGTLRFLNKQAMEVFRIGVARLTQNELKKTYLSTLLGKIELELKNQNKAYLEFKVEEPQGVRWLEIRAISTKDEIILVANDITYKKCLEERINNLAFFDQDSQLPNRNYFSAFLSKTQRAHLLFLTVTNWDELIKIIGYLRLNKVVSKLFSGISKSLSEYAVSFRLYDNLLVFALKNKDYVEKISEVVSAVERILIREEGIHLAIGLNGILLTYPEDAQSLEELIVLSALALAYLKRAKIKGVRQLSQLGYIKDILLSIKDTKSFFEKLELVLHPIHSAQTHKVVGAEVLVRVRFNNRLLSVGPLFDILEDEGFILELDSVLWEKFLGIYDRCLKNYDLQYNFNVSPPGFLNVEFMEMLLDGAKYINRKKGVCLEITERSKLTESEELSSNIKKLIDAGFAIAIDDFGAESASLEYIRYLRVHKIKLDGSIVKDADSNKRTQLLISAITSVGKILGVEIGAEFVERPSQAELLRDLGCKFFQGFLFSEPMELKDFVEFVKQNS